MNYIDDNTTAKQPLETSKSHNAINKSYYDRLLQKHNYQGNTISSKTTTHKIYNKMKEHYLLFWENNKGNFTKLGLEFFRTQNPNYNNYKYLNELRHAGFSNCNPMLTRVDKP